MPDSGWAFCFCALCRSAPLLAIEVLALKLGALRGSRSLRWLGATCALALVCTCGSAVQAGARGVSVDAGKTASDKPVSPKKHAKAAAKASGTPSAASKHKAHPASHPPAGSHPKSNVTHATHPGTTKHASSRKRKKTARGQKKIDPDRAQEIQEALIREHYLTGEATGKWNQASEDAMRRYQADHGWQSKTVPDSRALINLGLGPSHDHLLNPESAMTTGPSPLHSASAKIPAPDQASAPHIVATPAASPTPDPKPAADSNQTESSPQ